MCFLSDEERRGDMTWKAAGEVGMSALVMEIAPQRAGGSMAAALDQSQSCLGDGGE